MKKFIIAVAILFTLSCLAPVNAIDDGSSVASQNDEIYRNISLTLISPYVNKAIDNFYDEYLTYLPRENPWDYKILSIETPHPGYYFYTVKLEVLPYVGPHLTVGIDHITLKIDLSGTVEIALFEHLESHELPPHYQDIIKKKLPSA